MAKTKVVVAFVVCCRVVLLSVFALIAILVIGVCLNPFDYFKWTYFGATSGAEAACENGDFDHAIECAEYAIRKWPSRPGGYLARGYAYELQGAFSAALSDYRLAMTKGDGGFDMHLRCGHAFYKSGDYSDASNEYALAVIDIAEANAERLDLIDAWLSMPFFGREEPIATRKEFLSFLHSQAGHEEPDSPVLTAISLLEQATLSETPLAPNSTRPTPTTTRPPTRTTPPAG